MEAFELSKLINSINSILLQDVSTIKTISSTEMWPSIYVCNMDKFVPLLPETLFHFSKRFSWNVRMFYRSKQLIEHLNLNSSPYKPILTVNRASKSLNQVIKFWWLWRLCGAAMEAFELSKLINSINSILLQDVSTIKTISSTEMWPPIYVCNMDKFVPLLPESLFHFPKRFSWNVRMFYRSKQLIEHLNQQFKSLQAHSNR